MTKLNFIEIEEQKETLIITNGLHLIMIKYDLITRLSLNLEDKYLVVMEGSKYTYIDIKDDEILNYIHDSLVAGMTKENRQKDVGSCCE